MGANRNDSADYSCEITNDFGKTMDKARLNVRCGPLFTKKLKDTKANEGDHNIEFEISVECYPKPLVRWYRK